MLASLVPSCTVTRCCVKGKRIASNVCSGKVRRLGVTTRLSPSGKRMTLTLGRTGGSGGGEALGAVNCVTDIRGSLRSAGSGSFGSRDEGRGGPSSKVGLKISVSRMSTLNKSATATVTKNDGRYNFLGCILRSLRRGVRGGANRLVKRCCQGIGSRCLRFTNGRKYRRWCVVGR